MNKLDKIIEEKAKLYFLNEKRSYHFDKAEENLCRTDYKAGFKAALTPEVLKEVPLKTIAEIPAIKFLMETLEAVLDNDGLTYEQAHLGNKIIVHKALKPFADVGEE
ncbi:MAG: hypothetical protein COB41_00640 [Proteobacteria bacterium]|nr:MAG: hypothetical protein COB41_00025 [Pseudomonadota bacterium]PCI45930.1 MAG: hypothetical protein COB41_00640 [Pseudomonadota bacterium]